MLNGVTVTPNGDVWAVGFQRVEVTVTDPADAARLNRPLLLKRAGGHWKAHDVSAFVQPCPVREDASGQVAWIWTCGAELADVDASPSGDVWAVGTETAADFVGYDSVVLRSRSDHWSRVARPRTRAAGGLRVADLAVTSAAAWVLELFVDDPNWGRYRILRLGDTTSPATEFTMPRRDLAAVGPIGKSSAWIVGTRQITPLRRGPLVLRWDGTTFRRQHTVLDTLSRGETLHGVSVLAPGEVWAAGDGLVARYSSTR
jgi:hypothetical protein